MTGRRRRASTSSVDTIDESQIRWRQESSVLRSVPKGQSSDDWPIFELRDAVVLDKHGVQLENALDVTLRGPFVVRGHLIIDDPSQKSHLIMRVRTSTPLEIRKSTSYSIGEADDGRALIWVSGQGGWYEINPAPSYKEIYNKMCEATTMYYSIVDIYNSDPPKKTKKSKGGYMEELGIVFHKYASRIGDSSTLEEVKERCKEHANFFIEQFAHDTEAVESWQSTAIYKWLMSQKENLQSQPPAPGQTSTRSSPTSPPQKRTRENLSIRSRSTRSMSTVVEAENIDVRSHPEPDTVNSAVTSNPAQSSPSSVVPLYELDPSVDSPADLVPFGSVLQGIEDIYSKLTKSRNGLTLSGTLNRLYFEYKFPCYRDGTVGCHKKPAQEFLHYYSAALLEALDKSKYGKHELYARLQEMAQTEFRPVAYHPSDFPLALLLRASQPRGPRKNPLVPATPVSGNDESATGSDVPAPRGKRPGRPRGTKSSLRPITPAPKKRPRSQFESDSEQETPNARKSHYFSDDDNDDSMADAPELESDVDDDDMDESKDDPASSRYDLEPIKLVIRAEKLPSSSPRGPNDTWTCDQDGCDYIVRGGDEAECQERIKEHFRDHEKQMTLVSLAVNEANRGHVPINHLLEKLKQMNQKKEKQGSNNDNNGSSEDLATQPIKRKLIV